jgi:hypothetical protein
MVTSVPIGPEVGLNEVITGVWAFNVPTARVITAENRIFKKRNPGEDLFIIEKLDSQTQGLLSKLAKNFVKTNYNKLILTTFNF